jgi:hypothetical protein
MGGKVKYTSLKWNVSLVQKAVQPASTSSLNLAKNWPARRLAVELISRLPSWAILPPTSALAV